MLNVANPAEQQSRGYAQGLQMLSGQQQLAMNRSAEARANELHPLAMQGQKQGLAIDAAQEARRAEMQPYQVQGAQLGIDAERQKIDAQKQALARREQFSAAMSGLAEKGSSATYQDYQQVQAQFPEFGQAVVQGWEGMDTARKQGTTSTLMQVGAALKGGQTDTAIEMANQFADAAENSGDPAMAATARSLAETMKSNPNAALATLGLTVASVDPDAARKLFGNAAGGSGDGPVRKTQILDDGTIVRAYDNKITVTSPNGDDVTGEAAADAIRQAQAYGVEVQGARASSRTEGSNLADTRTASGAQAAKDLGALQVKFVEDANKNAQSIGSSLRNFDRAIEAIDAGGSAGAINKYLPDITKASAELTNAMNSLGLDVVGSVTFGALSEGELNLAMSVAVPRNLEAPELRAWMVERRDAQEKVRTALLEQASFLSDPNNSLDDWYQKIGVTPPGGNSPATDTTGGGSYMDLLGR